MALQSNNKLESKIPQCIGVIMDGNRRWAKKKSLPTLVGHKKGYEKLKEFLEWAKNNDVRTVIAYAFSAENWNRNEQEVSYLMDLFRFALKNEIATLAKDDTKLLFIGDKSHMPMDIQDMMNDAEKLTANNSSTTLAIAVSYGGRSEIVEACGRLKQESVEVSESAVTSHLYTAGLPDPDIILRTGGQKRLSGFLPWQCIYSELFFTDTLWPDYSKDEFEAMLKEYSERQRNFGK